MKKKEQWEKRATKAKTLSCTKQSMAWIGRACDRFFPTPIKLMAKLPLALMRAGSDPASVHWKLPKGQKTSSLNDIQHFSSYGNFKFLSSVWCSQSWAMSYIHFRAQRLLRDTGTSEALRALWETLVTQPIILTTKIIFSILTYC